MMQNAVRSIARVTKKRAKKIWGFIKRHKLELTYMAGLVIIPAAVQAWTNAGWNSGTFAYDVYDIAVNKIAKGPIGFVTGAGCLAGGVFSAIRSAWVPAIAMAVGGGLIYKLDTIAKSLGFTI